MDLELVLTHFRARLRERLSGEAGAMAFDAFISYSHAADGRLAPALQRAMQRLAKPWYRPRAIRVFRDESALSANPHLWSSIESALDDAAWLVLLASPDAVASEWVNRELDHWLATKSIDHILVVVTDGTWAWDRDRRELAGSAVPPALRDAFTDEPRHVELSWARSETDLDLRNSRFRDAVAQLAAPVHGIAKDELEGEDIRLHRRARRLARGGVSVLALLVVIALGFGTVAVVERNRANRSVRAQEREALNARRQRDVARREANVALAGDLASESQDALRDGRNDVALLLAVQSERTRATLASKSSLLGALVDQPMLYRELHGLTRTTTDVAFSPDAHRLMASDGERLRVWDLRSGQPLAPQPNLAGARFADDGRLLIGTDRTGFVVTDAESGHVLWRLPSPTSAFWAASSLAPILAIGEASGTVTAWNVRTGHQLVSIATGEHLAATLFSTHTPIALSADGASVAVVVGPDLPGRTVEREQVWSIASGEPVGPGCITTPPPTGAETLLSVEVLPDDQTVRTVRSGFGTSIFTAQCHADVGTVDRDDADLQFTQSNDLPEVTAVSPNQLVVATRDGRTIQLLDATSGATIGDPVRAPYRGGLALADTVTFSADSRLFAALEYNGDVRIWRTAPQSAIEQLTDVRPNIDRIVHSEHRQVEVTRRGDVIDPPTHQRLGHIPNYAPALFLASPTSLPTLSDSPTRLRMSADGRLLAASTAGSDFIATNGDGELQHNTLSVVDLQRHTSHTIATDLACPSGGGASPVAISGVLAVVGGCDGYSQTCGCFVKAIQPVYISSWPWRKGAPIRVGADTILRFSPNGKVLALFGADVLQLVDVGKTELRPRPPLLGPGSASCFNLAPDCLTHELNLVSAQWDGVFAPDGSALVLDQNNGLFGIVPTEHAGQPTLLSLAATNSLCTTGDCPSSGLLAFSPDGQLLATAGPGAIRLWDFPTRQLIGTIPLPADLVDLSVAVSMNITTTSLTINTLTSQLVVDLQPTSWQQQASAIANRNLTRAESAQYAGSTPYKTQCPRTAAAR